MIAPFVDVEWLAARPETVIADVRWSLGAGAERDAYLAGHLPRAVFVDLDQDLAAHDLAGAGRHPLPEPAAFAAAMGRAGIGDGATVVAYDDAGGVFAARLVWMLRALGEQAALLDGGLAAWNGELEAGAVAIEPANFSPRPWPSDRIASIEELPAPGATVLDARGAERFAGLLPDGVDPRPGHIPGARSLPYRGNLDGDGKLLPQAKLRERFAAVGIERPGQPIIASCGSGVTACHNLLVAELLGLSEQARLFPGSWSQYSADSGRPAETGADPAGLT